MVLKGKSLLEDPILADFIDIELAYDGMKSDLLNLLTNYLNIVSFEYECNQYSVLFDGKDKTITIRDAVHESHSIPQHFKRVSMSVDDFLKILSQP